MNNKNLNNNLIRNFQNFVTNNVKTILILTLLLVIVFISFQTYIYLSTQAIKKTSINFFNSIDGGNEIHQNLNKIKNEDNFFSILSKLHIIQNNNKNYNFSESNELYKEIISSKDLENLYKSSIAAHASYTLINATYEENTLNYLNDISFYINNINDDLESFYSIKKELEYLLIVTEADLNKHDYKNNSKAKDLYNNIYNSSLISSSVKERVKKIHEFQLYK